MPRTALLASFLAVLLAAPSSAQTPKVWVVDVNGGVGVHFTALGPAIAAAGEGDVLLIRPGSFQAVASTGPYATIDAKSLVLQGDPAGGPFIGKLRVSNLEASQSVVVRGVGASLVAISDCAGPVLVEECALRDLDVRDTSDAIVRGCSVTASFLIECEGGIRAIRSGLYVYDSQVEGFSATIGGGQSGCGSAPGIRLSESEGHIEGSTVTGGSGAISFGYLCEAAALVVQSGSSVTLRDVSLIPGSPAYCGTPPFRVLDVSTLEMLSGTARILSTPSPVRALGTTELVYKGEPGDVVWLGISPSLAPSRWFTQIQGFYHGVWPATIVSKVGVVPSGGELRQSITVGSLPGSKQVLTLFMQAYFFSTSGQGHFSTPTQVQLLQSTL